MLVLLLNFLLLLNFNNDFILKKSTDWHEGVVTLKDSQILEGKLSYIYNTNVILYSNKNKIKAFPADKVESFYIISRSTNSNRFYISSEFPLENKRVKKVFLEVITLGKIPVYRISTHKNILDQLPGFKDYHYYAFINDEYIHFKDFHKQIYPTLAEEFEGEIKQYIKKRKLRVADLQDQMKIISFFNALHLSDENNTVMIDSDEDYD